MAHLYLTFSTNVSLLSQESWRLQVGEDLSNQFPSGKLRRRFSAFERPTLNLLTLRRPAPLKRLFILMLTSRVILKLIAISSPVGRLSSPCDFLRVFFCCNPTLHWSVLEGACYELLNEKCLFKLNLHPTSKSPRRSQRARLVFASHPFCAQFTITSLNWVSGFWSETLVRIQCLGRPT